jgi:phage tail protein X
MAIYHVEIINSEGFTLAQLIWRFLNRQPAGYAEAVLDANPGLADAGPMIPVGTTIRFPLDEIPDEAEQSQQTIHLWD